MESKNLVFLLKIITALFVLLAVIGGVRGYSVVPYWDMWDGYIDFFTKVSGGDISVWWSQHNEHRIVLTRIFFIIDFYLFSGTGVFLVILNYMLFGLFFTLFYLILNEALEDKNNKLAQKSISLLLLIFTFSWLQSENLTWGFQSQFVLAQLLPLLAFYLLHKSNVSKISSLKYYIFSVFVGIIAAGSMANGILVLPLMTVLAIILSLGWKKVSILLIVSVSVVTAYFYDYTAPGGHASLSDSLIDHPFDLMQYALTYLGGPIYYMMARSLLMAKIAGLFLIVSAVFFSYLALRNIKESSLQLVLLTFVLYICGTALATGGGRLIFGVEQALSSRYMTPALMAWSAVLILYSRILSDKMRANPKRYMFLILIISILLLPKQLTAVRSTSDNHYERLIAALALELGIKDQQQISNIFPSAEWALAIAEKPSKMDVSIFGNPLIKDVKQSIGMTSLNRSSISCQGSLDEVAKIEGENEYMKVRGWFYQADAEKSPKVIHLLNNEYKIIGYALSGQSRPDVESVINPKAANSGFKGYMIPSKINKTILIKGYQPDCELEVKMPLVPYVQKNAHFSEKEISVYEDQVLGVNDWVGSDYYRTKIQGYKVYGSFITGDSDVGSIILKLKKGDSLYYRSGPTGGNQSLLIDSGKYPARILPVSADWKLIEFSDLNLPEIFNVEFKDSGADWGEWSAIVVLEGGE